MEQTPEAIRASVQQRYANLARTPESERTFPIGPQSAKALGYPADEIDALSASVTESFAGVGHPFSLGRIERGQTVLDLGCGARPHKRGSAAPARKRSPPRRRP